jgi:hypothetical protein
MRKIKRIIRRLRPFRGTYSYECQVGPMVVLWYHDEGMCGIMTKACVLFVITGGPALVALAALDYGEIRVGCTRRCIYAARGERCIGIHNGRHIVDGTCRVGVHPVG